VAALTAAPALAGVAADASNLVVERLQTDAADAPLGIDSLAPRLRWRLRSEARGTLQTAYRVLVATRAELATPGAADVWDSGDVKTSDPWCVYAGPALRSRTRYHWSVSVATNAGAAASRPAWFETALLSPTEWRAEWIAGPERAMSLTPEEGAADDARIRAEGELCRPVGWLTRGFASRIPNNQGECRELRPAPMLRKAFRLRGRVSRARLYASGLAYGRLLLNGLPVSDRVLDPAFTNYAKTVLYTTDDVTALVREGDNVLAAELGSGHFDDATRTWDWGWTEAEWRATPRLRLELHVVYDDGKEELVASDASWRTSDEGPRRYDSLYLGETYDARKEQPGWAEPGFDDARWVPARAVSAPSGVPRAQALQPIRVVSERPAGSRSEPAPGVFVYDVGQNLTGWAEIRVRAPAGTAVEVFYSEKLDERGRASTKGNDLVHGQLQTDYYVARGTAGEEAWTPAFSYKGFQYVQLSAPGGAPLPGGVSASVARVLQVRSSLPRTASFESSQPTLDRIHRNTAWAVESNFHGVVTDTPVYEKNPWTGDAHFTAGTASILFDTERLYRKLLQDMLDAQAETGELPLLCPTNRNYGYVGKPAFKPADCCGATPAWDAFWFVVPWESYMRHGDRDVLERAYPAMRRYLDEWAPRWTGKDGDAFGGTLTSGLGDWVAPSGVPTLNALASTAYYARIARIAAEAARVLGRAEDARRHAALFERIKADFTARFLSADGAYRESGDQPFLHTAQVLPLAFDLVPDARRGALAARLAEDIRGPRGGNAQVGILGATHVLPVLTATGHNDAAFGFATQTDEPSWGYWTDVAGFTALGEHWPADTRSRNHHFFGAIVQWLYEDLAGIRALEPGYARIEFRPELPSDGLEHVKASFESVRGPVATSWRRTADGLALEVTVPANATGRVYVPAADASRVRESGTGRALAVDAAPGVRLAAVSGGRVVLDVGSGTYRFEVGAPSGEVR
jgi:alpha-L-rhamnosidase